MGKLALYGGLAGAGESLIKGSESKAETRKADTDFDRQQALIRLRGGVQTEVQAAGIEAEGQQKTALEAYKTQTRGKESTTEFGRGQEMQSQKDSAAMDRVLAQIAGKAAAADKDDPNRYALEGFRVETQTVVGENLAETTVQTIVDESTNIAYELRNDKFVQAGSSAEEAASLQEASKEDLDLLRERPADVYRLFYEDYNYLPRWTFGALRDARREAETASSARRREQP